MKLNTIFAARVCAALSGSIGAMDTFDADASQNYNALCGMLHVAEASNNPIFLDRTLIVVGAIAQLIPDKPGIYHFPPQRNLLLQDADTVTLWDLICSGISWTSKSLTQIVSALGRASDPTSHKAL